MEQIRDRKSAPRPKDPRRTPGVAVQMWVYRYVAARGRGGKRDLLFATKIDPNVAQRLAELYGVGRYRVELRDARGWLVNVRSFTVTERDAFWGRDPQERQSAKRQGKRRVPFVRELPWVRFEPVIRRSEVRQHEREDPTIREWLRARARR